MTSEQIRRCGSLIKFNKRVKVGKVCGICGSAEHLTVHHKRELWTLAHLSKKIARKIAKDPMNCQVLCVVCHNAIHHISEEKREVRDGA